MDLQEWIFRHLELLRSSTFPRLNALILSSSPRRVLGKELLSRKDFLNRLPLEFLSTGLPEWNLQCLESISRKDFLNKLPLESILKYHRELISTGPSE